ncbi:hypothetical protein DFJ77DRAFT_442225 [Powellomyces hirtus]|nr:hypothetical protein DFJ77DRAFT_442225 [Powellomyces hirtus]
MTDRACYLTLPPEIHFQIYSHLSSPSLLNVMSTCKKMFSIASDNAIWKQRCAYATYPGIMIAYTTLCDIEDEKTTVPYWKIYASDSRSICFPRLPEQCHRNPWDCYPGDHIVVADRPTQGFVDYQGFIADPFSVVAWFRTPEYYDRGVKSFHGGVIVGGQSETALSGSESDWVWQLLYVGEDGYIRGTFEANTSKPMQGPFVADGQWHCAVITARPVDPSNNNFPMPVENESESSDGEDGEEVEEGQEDEEGEDGGEGEDAQEGQEDEQVEQDEEGDEGEDGEDEEDDEDEEDGVVNEPVQQFTTWAEVLEDPMYEEALYVDGVKVATQNKPYVLEGLQRVLQIGTGWMRLKSPGKPTRLKRGWYPFHGALRDVRIYDRWLTAAEVRAHTTGPHNRFGHVVAKDEDVPLWVLDTTFLKSSVHTSAAAFRMAPVGLPGDPALDPLPEFMFPSISQFRTDTCRTRMKGYPPEPVLVRSCMADFYASFVAEHCIRPHIQSPNVPQPFTPPLMPPSAASPLAYHRVPLYVNTCVSRQLTCSKWHSWDNLDAEAKSKALRTLPCLLMKTGTPIPSVPLGISSMYSFPGSSRLSQTLRSQPYPFSMAPDWESVAPAAAEHPQWWLLPDELARPCPEPPERPSPWQTRYEDLPFMMEPSSPCATPNPHRPAILDLLWKHYR